MFLKTTVLPAIEYTILMSHFLAVMPTSNRLRRCNNALTGIPLKKSRLCVYRATMLSILSVP
jgi:hypothetical protein